MLFAQSSLLNWPPTTLWEAAIASLVFGLLGILLAILVFPLLGPLLYFVFRKPDTSPEAAEAALMAQADLQREAARRPTGGTCVYR